jgi:hypothetical protein
MAVRISRHLPKREEAEFVTETIWYQGHIFHKRVRLATTNRETQHWRHWEPSKGHKGERLSIRQAQCHRSAFSLGGDGRP